MRERLILFSRVIVLCSFGAWLATGHPPSRAQDPIPGESVPVVQARQAERIYDLDEHLKELENLEADRNTETHKQLDDIRSHVEALETKDAKSDGIKDFVMWVAGLGAAGGFFLQLRRNRPDTAAGVTS